MISAKESIHSDREKKQLTVHRRKTTQAGEQSSDKLDVVAGVTALIVWLAFLQRTDTACSRHLGHVNLTVWQLCLNWSQSGFEFA